MAGMGNEVVPAAVKVALDISHTPRTERGDLESAAALWRALAGIEITRWDVVSLGAGKPKRYTISGRRADGNNGRAEIHEMEMVSLKRVEARMLHEFGVLLELRGTATQRRAHWRACLPALWVTAQESLG